MPVSSFSKVIAAMFIVCVMRTGCMFIVKPTPKELQALGSPPANVSARIDRFFPHVLSWYEAVEAELLPQGRALSAHELDIARRLGVSHPERVRVVIRERFPLPGDPELLTEAVNYGLGGCTEGSRTNGYLIMLKPWLEGNETVLTYELLHVSQHDRMGCDAFLRRYLVKLEMMGYARSPLELEAYAKKGHVE